MAGRQLHWRRGVILAVVSLFCISLIAPLAAFADTNLVVGGTARVAYANGDDVRLRSATSSNADVLVMVPEGTTVNVLDGPITADDGSYWYQVQWGDTTGYIVSDYLALDDGTTVDVATDPATEEPTEAPQGPGDGVTGFALVLNTNGEGVRCRVAPDSNSTLITIVPEGSEISLLGGAQGEWQPILCGGVAGYVHIAYVSYDGSMPPGNAYFGEPVQEEPTEVPTEEPTQVATEEPTQVATEEPTEEPTQIATEEPTDVATEEPTEVVTEEPTQEATEEVPTETATVDEPATEEPTETATAEVPSETATVDASPTETATPEETSTPIDASPTVEVSETATATETATETATATEPATETATATPSVTATASPTATPQPDNSSDVMGMAIVSGTNGDGVRCRVSDNYTAAVITVVPEGTSVELRGSANGDFQAVFCGGGKKGFIVAQYLQVVSKDGGVGGPTVSTFTTAAEQTMKVSGTGGGLNCRTQPSMSGSVITIVSDGTSLVVRGKQNGDWLPVVCGGKRGFVFASYMKASGTSSSGSNGSGGDAVDPAAITGSATVNSGGDQLRCRAGAGSSASVITNLSDGDTVSLRGATDNSGQWQRVYCAGRKGWVAAQYLKYGTSGGGSNGGGSSSGWTAGSYAKVTGTGGDGVRLRSGASSSASIITVVGEGVTVQVASGSKSGWVAVVYNGQSGFISSTYLAKSSAPGGGTPGGGSGTTYRLNKGDHAETTSSLNLRYDASTSSGVAAVAPAGTVVLITGTPKSGFYPVDWDGLKGWMSNDYLSKTSRDLSDRGGSGNPGTNPGGNPGNGGGTATGNAIVNFAMQYVGYPYVWATAGPGSFDCSGFTNWVIKNVIGIDIGRSVPPQLNYGVAVAYSNLQPGDIVFFENTYTWGLSHVGIYIGNNQFVHAENETTGVRVSDITSSYYSSRYYGARRIS